MNLADIEFSDNPNNFLFTIDNSPISGRDFFVGVSFTSLISFMLSIFRFDLFNVSSSSVTNSTSVGDSASIGAGNSSTDIDSVLTTSGCTGLGNSSSDNCKKQITDDYYLLFILVF